MFMFRNYSAQFELQPGTGCLVGFFVVFPSHSRIVDFIYLSARLINRRSNIIVPLYVWTVFL
jgi:hypothetical protein